MPTEKLAKWQILLSEFDIIYVTQKAVKGQALANHLAENPVDGEYEPLKTFFPDEEVSFVGEDITKAYDGWKMFFDGATNFKGVCIRAVLVSETISITWYLQNSGSRAPVIWQNTRPASWDSGKNFIDPIPIGIHKQPTYCAHVEEGFDKNPWFHDIKEYLEKGEYPENATHKDWPAISFKAGELCIERLLIWDYCDLSMPMKHLDCSKKYMSEHIHADMIRVLLNKLNATSSPWPFCAWGMDVIGPIETATSNGHIFILVAIDYFTKWVEVASYKAVTKKVVADFVRDRIVCRFGVPESIITDNTANLNSDVMKATSETFRIKHQNSTTCMPQMNGAVEAANKNIKKILRKMVNNYMQWNEKLPFSLLGYRTTVRTSTGETPYLLVYGTEVVIPAEVEIPSFRIIQEALSDVEWIRS
ncbi:uncharacterized protein [Nicotiana tomentosiformis]|uniref:uncharacterized protein n=1 Tax=Nicotiana tomentosiformis TaxID=4098 RepID=UPI00388C67EE